VLVVPVNSGKKINRIIFQPDLFDCEIFSGFFPDFLKKFFENPGKKKSR
jgi:hypothetical protein